MTAPLRLTDAQIERLALLNKSHTVTEIARKLGVGTDMIRAQLKRMGLPPIIRMKPGFAQKDPKPDKLEPVRFPRFEDAVEADADRHTGAKPSRAPSLGCSVSTAAMAVR